MAKRNSTRSIINKVMSTQNAYSSDGRSDWGNDYIKEETPLRHERSACAPRHQPGCTSSRLQPNQAPYRGRPDTHAFPNVGWDGKSVLTACRGAVVSQPKMQIAYQSARVLEAAYHESHIAKIPTLDTNMISEAGVNFSPELFLEAGLTDEQLYQLFEERPLGIYGILIQIASNRLQSFEGVSPSLSFEVAWNANPYWQEEGTTQSSRSQRFTVRQENGLFEGLILFTRPSLDSELALATLSPAFLRPEIVGPEPFALDGAALTVTARTTLEGAVMSVTPLAPGSDGFDQYLLNR